jgi:hypothetical protein
MLLSFGSTLLATVGGVVQLGLAFLFFRFVFRTLVRRGQLRFPNPFQPGWRQLQRQYGIAQIIRPVERISGFTGAGACELMVRFEPQHWVLQGISMSGFLVRIPYSDIATQQSPTSFQVTRSSETEYTSGVFSIQDVRIELPAYWANQLLQHMAAANTSFSKTEKGDVV